MGSNPDYLLKSFLLYLIGLKQSIRVVLIFQYLTADPVLVLIVTFAAVLDLPVSTYTAKKVLVFAKVSKKYSFYLFQ